MFSLGVLLDVEKDAIDLTQAVVQGPQYGSAICLVREKRQPLDHYSHIDIRPAAIQPCDLPNNEPHVKSSDHWTPVVEICMKGVLG